MRGPCVLGTISPGQTQIDSVGQRNECAHREVDAHDRPTVPFDFLICKYAKTHQKRSTEGALRKHCRKWRRKIDIHNHNRSEVDSRTRFAPTPPPNGVRERSRGPTEPFRVRINTIFCSPQANPDLSNNFFISHFLILL